MKFVKLAILLLVAASLFSACTVYNETPPSHGKPAQADSPVQK